MHGAILTAFLIHALAQADPNPSAASPQQFKVHAFVCVIPHLPRSGQGNAFNGVWDGSGVSDEGFTLSDGTLKYDNVPGITILAEPSLISVQGEEAKIAIGSAGTDFLEPVPGEQGMFRTVHIAEGPNLELACTVQPKDSNFLSIAHVLNITRLTHRERLEGTDLEAGRPVFAKQQLEGSTLLRPGQWLVHHLYVSEDTEECIVFLMRVEPYRAPEPTR